MANLEYRLLDEAGEYPILFRYDGIDTGEIATRVACDKFIKNGQVYAKTSAAIEPLTYVIYLEPAGPAEGAAAPVPAAGPGALVEIRQDWEGESPGLIIESRHFTDAIDIVLHLGSDYLFWLGDEWLKTMTVLDEDRQAYVIYTKKTS
jgi:hypothetical protein